VRAGTVKSTVCCRCTGKGVLPHFSHVVGGICFRCWGSGVDPRTMNDLRKWLNMARAGYRTRQAALKTATPEARPRLVRDLAIIAQLGKKNRARLESLMAERQMGQATARQMTRAL
jgi:recombinational DNA repair protein (RecF pathway)